MNTSNNDRESRHESMEDQQISTSRKAQLNIISYLRDSKWPINAHKSNSKIRKKSEGHSKLFNE